MPKKYKDPKDKMKTLEDPEYDEMNGYDHEQKEEKEEDSSESINNKDKSSSLSEGEQKELCLQVDLEYRYSQESAADWIERCYRNLKLYNNVKREPNKVGDPLIFTVHQTVLASLYTDTLQVLFKGREEGDKNVASNLNGLAEYDFDMMDKDIVDYDWDWDAGFFGRGLLEFTHFDRDTLTPIPEVIDPITFLHDPRATSVAGSKLGKGSMRFGGAEIQLNKWDIEGNSAYMNTEKLSLDKKSLVVDSNWESLLERSRQARSEAHGTTHDPIKESEIGENGQIDVLKWYTFYKGKRCVVYLANNRTCIIRYHLLADDKKRNLKYFPIFDRPLYPNAHTWNATSIPDLLEDKQRLRAIMYNAMGDAVKADLYPMYIYNNDKIKNRADLDFAFNKHIGVPGGISDVIAPVNKASINATLADYVLQSLDAAAQKATATPEIQQGVTPDTQRTLGETELIASKSSTRYSLTAKVFGWSEKRLWQHWYFMNKTYWEKDIDEKLIRINGAYGDEYRKLTKENIVSIVDPDVQVVSKQVSEAQKIREQMRFEKFMQIAFGEPTSNKRYGLKKLAALYNMKPDEIDRLLPPTVDELQGIDENELLSANKLPEIKDNQNHVVHIEMHALAAETPAKRAHIKAHKEALRLQRERPDLFPNADPNAVSQAGITPTGAMTQNQAAGGGTGGQQIPNAAQQMASAAGSGQQTMPQQGLE